MADEELVLVERDGAVGMVTMNRPKALNALNAALIDAIVAALQEFDADPDIGCMVLTGSPRAFAAGADVKEMAPLGFADTYYVVDLITSWDRIATMRKPLIAAVSGFALGGGCEVAMMCDLIIASENAKFGQPEINLGVIPGGGGTQRLSRAIGKAKTMDLCLTGRMMDAHEAERMGLVARVVEDDKLIEEAKNVAASIAKQSRPALVAAKESVNRAFELSLTEGVRFERRLFQALFATEDQKEGMAAFSEKRKPAFKNR
ncbi:MAG: enoyl-CoA hydratase [Pseudomonadota bacterium]